MYSEGNFVRTTKVEKIYPDHKKWGDIYPWLKISETSYPGISMKQMFEYFTQENILAAPPFLEEKKFLEDLDKESSEEPKKEKKESKKEKKEPKKEKKEPKKEKKESKKEKKESREEKKESREEKERKEEEEKKREIAFLFSMYFFFFLKGKKKKKKYIGKKKES
eukprot:CAMPEP_0170198506 /NCGR_PEP_ID=MMETSP0040_2-20121228/68807_1 /TAXON_ID=641309 /ORGANISM="Lotharella oceanica, Strain CCMP622" /LENGTH=164 /DNA_ID=CAMNT_0010448501 /DNA_START=832 /DNA_END=1327 /DNA_ORIENTATION=+